MGALPKRRISRARKKRRRSQDGIKKDIPMSICSKCGSPKRPHFVCPNCGNYGSKEQHSK